MNIIKTFKRHPLAHWVACALAAVSVAGAVQAAPLAGTEIKNLATVSYEDENGNKYTAQSNEAVITVAPQYKATMENDRTQSAAPGQTVYFPHTMVNTGNIADTYTLAVDNPTAKIYVDTNGNGQPDSGEGEITSISLAVGETANVIVSYPVPTSANDGDQTTLTLTATSAMNGVIDDLAINNGVDGLEGTSTDVVSVTTGPVLVLNKTSVINATDKTITYTLTVKNTGGADAASVDILDALPMIDTNGDGTKDTQVMLVAGSIITNGLLDAGDLTATETDELTLGWDVNLDGAITGTTKVIKATDMVLSPNTTVSVSYTVSYNPMWVAGADIDNTFTAFADPDNNDRPDDPTNPPLSNTTHNDVPQNYGSDVNDDAGGTASIGVNDGQDDDGAANSDVQLVDKISSGDVALFTHTITNTGNGDDIFNLSVVNVSFPNSTTGTADTVFTLWNSDGTVQLTDSDGDGIPDTGILGQNESLKIVVKADLPAGASSVPATNHTATLIATSSADATVNDTTTLMLGEISKPSVDVAARGATQANTGLNDAGVADAHDEGPVMLKPADVGGTVEFPLTVANESGSADSFLFSTTNLPDGWKVVFKDSNGSTITSTPFLPAGSVFDYTAVITVANDVSKALGNSDRATTIDTDGHDINDNNTVELVDTDGDNDYVITFNVTSSVDSSRMDSISHAVDVNDIKAVSVTPDGQNQVQPGGTVDYPHTLKNDGNVDEAIELTSTNTDPDWSASTLIDTTGDGIGDTELSNLKDGDVIKVYNPDGSTTNVTLTDVDTDNNVEFSLKPGQYVKITNKVFAPADSPQGEVNTTTLSATNPDGTLRNKVEDNSHVILGQVRLTKTVAVDMNCDKTPETAFAEIQAIQIKPGECAVWEIFAKNEGGAKVKNVVITDIIPAYTTLIDDSLTIDGVSKTKVIGDDEAEVSNTGVLTYYLGTGTDIGNKMGGELLSGASSTVRFTVKIDE